MLVRWFYTGPQFTKEKDVKYKDKRYLYSPLLLIGYRSVPIPFISKISDQWGLWELIETDHETVISPETCSGTSLSSSFVCQFLLILARPLLGLADISYIKDGALTQPNVGTQAFYVR